MTTKRVELKSRHHAVSGGLFMLISSCNIAMVAQADVQYYSEKEDGTDDPCKFMSDYFSEFDLNPLTKLDGTGYTNQE